MSAYFGQNELQQTLAGNQTANLMYQPELRATFGNVIEKMQQRLQNININ
jgi:hypothetical protein